MNDLKPQLAPGWSPVNIALLIVLFLIFKPLAFVMLAYILLGRRLGIDLSRPETFGQFFGRIKSAWRAGSNSFSNQAQGSPGINGAATGGTPAPSLDKARQLDEQSAALAAERDALARERAAFEQEKNDRTV